MGRRGPSKIMVLRLGSKFAVGFPLKPQTSATNSKRDKPFISKIPTPAAGKSRAVGFPTRSLRAASMRSHLLSRHTFAAAADGGSGADTSGSGGSCPHSEGGASFREPGKTRGKKLALQRRMMEHVGNRKSTQEESPCKHHPDQKQNH